MTSVANRTSPVLRGKYIISNLLNTPPLPPPAWCRTWRRARTRTGRPPCASSSNGTAPTRCARRAIATSIRWASRSRTSTPSGSGGRPRARGWPSTRPACSRTARKVDSPSALRKALLARPDVFVGTITEKMLIYALGRGLEPVDMPVVRSIVKNAAAQNYAMQSIVLGIVRSAPFQMRTNLRDAAAPVTTSARGERSRSGRSSGLPKEQSDDRHEEAPAAADVPPRCPRRGDGDAVPRRDDSGALGAGHGAAVPLRGDLHPERHLPAAVASGHDRQRLRVQAGHAAARAVPQPPGDRSAG